jgi:hypothetical protein
VAKSDS